MKTRVALAIAITLLPGLAWVDPVAPAFASRMGAASVKQPESALLGEWIPESKDGRIKFEKAPDGTYMGIVSWAAAPKKDANNPDPKLRDRTTLGVIIIWHLQYDGDEYVGGYCYNPNDGRTYRMKVELLGADTLKVRGYLAIPLLGQTQEWTRYH
jgi:uncharacterized protein (DUF2147 family)